MARPTFSHGVQGALLLVALVAPLGVGPYWTHVSAIAWYYALLAASWALLAGFAGQFSFAHVAFAALGGYASALCVSQLGLPIVVGALVGVLLSIIMGAFIGMLGLRLSVAVGTVITHRPPRRSRRAAFPHRAPAEGRT